MTCLGRLFTVLQILFVGVTTSPSESVGQGWHLWRPHSDVSLSLSLSSFFFSGCFSLCHCFFLSVSTIFCLSLSLSVLFFFLFVDGIFFISLCQCCFFFLFVDGLFFISLCQCCFFFLFVGGIFCCLFFSGFSLFSLGFVCALFVSGFSFFSGFVFPLFVSFFFSLLLCRWFFSPSLSADFFFLMSVGIVSLCQNGLFFLSLSLCQ